MNIELYSYHIEFSEKVALYCVSVVRKVYMVLSGDVLNADKNDGTPHHSCLHSVHHLLNRQPFYLQFERLVYITYLTYHILIQTMYTVKFSIGVEVCYLRESTIAPTLWRTCLHECLGPQAVGVM